MSEEKNDLLENDVNQKEEKNKDLSEYEHLEEEHKALIIEYATLQDKYIALEKEYDELKNREVSEPENPEKEDVEDVQKPFEVHSRREKRKKTKVKKWLGEIGFYGVLICLFFTLILVLGNGEGAPKSFAGFSAFTVLTGSMQDEIPQGSLVITKYTDPALLEVGDDITYMSGPTSTITHRIIAITEDFQETGQRAFKTQGIMNEAPDEALVPGANIVGKVIYHNLKLGQLASLIRRNWPLYVFLLVVLGVLIKVLQKILSKED